MALRLSKKEEGKKKEVVTTGLFGILKSPCITEKAARLGEDNFYVFKVSKESNKKQVKDAIESQYKVDVERVMMINIPRKRKFQGKKISGFKSGYRKAIVKVKQGQKIEVIGK